MVPELNEIMNICIQLFTSSFVLLLSLIMFSSSALALDLNDIIHLAISRDAKFQADRLRAEAKNADGWQSVAGYGPTLSVSGTYMESRDSTDPQNSSEVEGRVAHFQEPGLTIGLEQPVIDLEKASNVMRGKSEMAVAELLLKKSREELLLRVHERY